MTNKDSTGTEAGQPSVEISRSPAATSETALIDEPQGAHRPQGRSKGFWLFAVAGIAVLVALPWLGASAFHLHVLISIGITTILALGVYLMLQVGEVTFAQAGLAGIGSYTSGLLALRVGVNVWLSMLLAIVVAVIVSVVLGRLILRGAVEFYFVLITFAFAEVARLFLLAVFSEDGVAGIPSPNLFGFMLDDRASYYLLVLAAVCATVGLAHRVMASGIGRYFDACKTGLGTLAPAMGIDTMRYRLLAFVLAGALAGLSGALQVHYLNFTSANLFRFDIGVLALTAVIIGGMDSRWGPLIGSFALVVTREYLRGFAELHILLYGLLLLVVVLFAPQGIVGVFQALRQRVRRTPKHPAPAAPSMREG